MNRLGTLLLAGVCAAQAVAEDAMKTPNLKDTRLEGPLAVKADRLFRNRIADPLMRETIFEEARRAFVLRDDDEDNNGAKGNWRGEFWGKSMLCAARVADYLDDAALKAWIPGECARLAATADADGYIGSYSSATNCVLTGADLDRDECNTNWNLWGRKYTIWALLEAWRVTGDETARATAVAQARHFIATVDKLAERGVGLADTGCHWLNGIPTMSVLKPMLLLYRETKEPEFLAFANRIVAQWDRADDRPPNFLRNAGNGRPYHEWYARPDFWAKTYESLSCLDGLVEHWRVTGSRRSLDAAIAVRDELAAHEGNQIGGLGICDKLIGAETFTYAATEVCDVIHWIRLNLDLFLTTGDKRFLDDAETSYFNAFLAGVDRSGSWGPLFVRDFARHTVSKGQCGYAYHHCCIDNAPRTFLDMASCAVTRDAAGTFHVNFFQDATVTLDGVAFEIRGDWPAHDTVRVTVAGDARVAFRRPAWCRDLAVAEARTDGKAVYTLTFDMNPRVVSRQTVPSPDTPDGFFLRKWGVWRYTFANGEDLKAHLPAAPYATVMYGPLVLAKAARLGASRAELQRTDTVNGQGYSAKLTPLAEKGVYAPFAVELSRPGAPTIRTKACAYESAGDDPTGNRYFAFSIRF